MILTILHLNVSDSGSLPISKYSRAWLVLWLKSKHNGYHFTSSDTVRSRSCTSYSALKASYLLSNSYWLLGTGLEPVSLYLPTLSPDTDAKFGTTLYYSRRYVPACNQPAFDTELLYNGLRSQVRPATFCPPSPIFSLPVCRSSTKK